MLPRRKKKVLSHGDQERGIKEAGKEKKKHRPTERRGEERKKEADTGRAAKVHGCWVGPGGMC